jgi:hypothetical protein
MRRCGLIVLFSGLVLLLAAPRARASNFGLGVIFGEPPVGLSLKLWPAGPLAFDAALSWSEHEGRSRFRFHADALVHARIRLQPESGRLSFYYGLGGRYLEAGERFGLRAPLGLDYTFGRVPFEAFLEFVPTLDLTPNTEFFAKFAAGLRVYFF